MLVTENDTADVSQLVKFALNQGAPEIAIPKRILKVSVLPVLGTGKTDYGAVQRIADAETPEAA